MKKPKHTDRMKAIRADIEAVLSDPHADPNLVSTIATIAMYERDATRAKLSGGKAGRKAEKLKPIRAALRELHDKHPKLKAAALARVAMSEQKTLFSGKSARRVEDLAQDAINGK